MIPNEHTIPVMYYSKKQVNKDLHAQDTLLYEFNVVLISYLALQLLFTQGVYVSTIYIYYKKLDIMSET